MMMWGALYTVTSQCRFLSPSGAPTANAFLVNGGDVEEGRNNGASIVPTLESIQEFRLITNSFDAEYGRFSGAIVNVITKGGSNDFHGPGLNNWDFSLHKTTRITERMSAEFRAEFFNVFNHAQFGNPSGNLASGSFGKVTGAREPRIGQLALKFYF